MPNLKELDFSIVEEKPPLALGELDFSTIESVDVSGPLGDIVPVKREKLPGVWGINKQLDGLFSGEKSIDDLLPMDLRYDFGKIVGMTEKPDELKDKMENSIFYSVALDKPSEMTFDLVDTLNEIAFKNPIPVEKALKEYRNYYTGQKNYYGALTHAYRRMNITAADQIGGWSKAIGEFLEPQKRIKPMFPTLNEWEQKYSDVFRKFGDMMRDSVNDYYQEHQDEAIGLSLGGKGIGFIQTMREAINDPTIFVEGLIESIPMQLEAALGTAVGGPVGAAAAMGFPIAGSVYADARAEGTEPLDALAQAILTGTTEGAIESWTFSRKLGLFRNFQNMVSQGLPRILWEGTKAYIRGMAEETGQGWFQNLWNYIFTDRSQKLNEGVASAAALGGPMELVMAGGFAAAGAATGWTYNVFSGKNVPIDQQMRRIELIRTAVEKDNVLTPEHKVEINNELDKVVEDVKTGVYVTPEIAEKAPGVPVEARKPVEPTVTAPEPDYSKLDPTQKITISTVEGDFPMTVEEAVYRLDDITDPEIFDGLSAYEATLLHEEASEIHKELNKLQPVPEAAAQAPAEKPREITSKEEIKEPEKPMYYMERVKGLGFVIKETATGKEKITIAKRAEAQSKLAELNLRAKPIISTTETIPKILTTEEKLISESAALKASLKKAEQAARISYKMGRQEQLLDSKRKIETIMIAQTFTEQNRKDAVSIVQDVIPKEKQFRYINRILKATSEKRVLDLTQSIHDYIEKERAKTAERELRNNITQIYKDYKRGKTELGKIGEPQRTTILEILKPIQPHALTEEKLKELTARQEYIQRTAGTVADAYRAILSESNTDLDIIENILQMPNAKIRELERISKTSIRDLSPEQIQFINDSLKHLVDIHEKKVASRHRLRAEQLFTTLNQSEKELNPKVDKLGIIPEIESLGKVKKFNLEASRLRTLIKSLTGKENSATMKVLVDDIQDAYNDKYCLNVKNLSEYVAKKFADAGITESDFTELGTKVEVTLGGKKIDLTYGKLMMLYKQARANLKDFLSAGGLEVTMRERAPETLYFAKRTQYITNKISPVELRNALIKLPEKFKGMVEKNFEINREMAAPMINETSVDLDGYPIARIDPYCHLSRVIQRTFEGTKVDLDVSVAFNEQGRALPRTGGKSRLRLVDWDADFIEEMLFAANYNAFSVPFENARTVLANRKWRDKARRLGLETILKNYENILRRAQGVSYDQTVLEQTLGKTLRRASRGILAGRIFSGTFIQMPGALNAAAAGIIPAKYFTGVPTIMNEAQRQHLMDISPPTWLRYRARQYDYAIGALSQQNAASWFIFNRIPFLDKFTLPYQAGDWLQIGLVWNAANKMAAETQNLTLGTPECEQAALPIYHRALEEQGQWHTLSRSTITSSPNVLTRSLTMFSSFNLAQYNILMQAKDDLAKGRIGEAEFTERVSAVVGSRAMSLAIRRGFRYGVFAATVAVLTAFGLKRKDAEETLKEEAKKEAVWFLPKVVFDLVEIVPVVGPVTVRIGYGITSAIKQKRPPTEMEPVEVYGQMINSFNKFMGYTGFAVYQAITGEEYKTGKKKGQPKWETSAKEAAFSGAEFFGYLFGTPVSGPMQELYYPAKRAIKATEEVKRKIRGTPLGKD